MDRCARRWQDPPQSSAANGRASLVKECQTRNGSRGGSGGAGWQSDVNRCQQCDVNWLCNQQNFLAGQDWSCMTISVSTLNEELLAAQHNKENLSGVSSLRDGCNNTYIVRSNCGELESLCSCWAVASLVSEIWVEVRWDMPYMFTGSLGKMSAGKTRWRITLCERPVERCGALHWDNLSANWELTGQD